MKDSIQSQMPRKNYPRDVFLHLFTIVALYWSAVSLITLCWQYINYFFPDIMQMSYGYQPYIWAIRFSVSSLIIIFPLFILSSWYLNKIYSHDAKSRDSKIRKWLIYLTLFIAALVIIINLITVVFNFLGGDMTIKFLLKALSVLLVAGTVFGYYLDDVRRVNPSKSAKYFALASVIFVFVLVIGAFFIIGSPASARLAQLDRQRRDDLQNIQWQIVNYWQRKGEMPLFLSDLEDPISGYFVPVDPETKESYEYMVKNAENLVFELCANFKTASIDEMMVPRPVYDVYSQNWNHLAERTCFERKIDPQLYPPLNERK